MPADLFAVKATPLVKMRSSESGHMYLTSKNRQNTQRRLELKKYDPFVRKHVVYREAK